MKYILLARYVCLVYQFSTFHAAELSPEIIAATQPLHRNIDILNEKIDTLEARHETLEAATEQFRLKVKSLKEKLSEEKTRYEWLMQSKTIQEERQNEEISALNKRIEEVKTDLLSMGVEYEKVLTEEREKISDYESDLALKNEEIASFKDRVNVLSQEVATLQASLGAYDVEMLKIKSENDQLRLDNDEFRQQHDQFGRSNDILRDENYKLRQGNELLAQENDELRQENDQFLRKNDQLSKEINQLRLDNAELIQEKEQFRQEKEKFRQEKDLFRQELLQRNNKLEELEAKVEMAQWRTSWKDIVESEAASATFDVFYEYWEWLKDDVVPHSIERFLVLFNSIRHSVIVFCLEASEYTHKGYLGLVGHVRENPDGLYNTIPTKILDFFAGALDDMWLRATSIVTRIWEEKLVPKLSPYLEKTPIALMIRVFSRLAKVHNAIASSLEWLAATLLNYHGNDVEGSYRSWLHRTCIYIKGHSHRIVLLLEVALGLLALDISLTSLRRSHKRFTGVRRVSKVRQSAVLTPKGTTPSASLLRTAGGLSLRPP